MQQFKSLKFFFFFFNHAAAGLSWRNKKALINPAKAGFFYCARRWNRDTTRTTKRKTEGTIQND